MVSMVFGLCGSGKSVFLAKCAKTALDGKALKIGGHYLHYGDYDHVLSNFYCEGCDRLDPDTLGKADYQNCLFLMDEASLLFDSRHFKTFSEDAKFFFSQHRKGGNTAIICSQGWDDVDKRIRNITDNYYYIRPSRIFGDKMSTIIPIEPFFDIIQGKPTNSYEFAPPMQCSHIWLPRYWNYIDSYAYINAKKLEQPVFQPWKQGI